ncbi:nickel ABC transporter, ATP-binding protein [Citrifermentans bemidjiense Bem]|uniref:Nickel ABC transporter, ATP-binding protein n=1 Tax=Citrifermentans bemidjiense (strain ATCC BAA-1014 / DSM 16622 / JCM 12645 / Bem) TaxID=404380 RepID=B5EE90_CITBB|nr:ABC transporter ATP-binding protein [Citrifermentans bemidjiense]ACH39235.1 nickel ABC transporter, ATP-binding protein [Citrifermentans bemidjiense Bem]
MSHHILEIDRLRHVYPDGTEALRDVSIRIVHGESVAVIGANGAGKSTLLAHLNGHLLPTSGAVRVGHLPVGRDTLAEIRRTVGMVFHDPDDQLFMPTVYEDVAFGPMNLGLSGEDLERCVKDALRQVDALHLAGKPPYHLSAGEKRRVAIATVLSMAPDILVMDEPGNGLDPYARRQLINLLKDFKHSKIVTSHDLDLVLDLCERTVVLSGGEVRADGPTREIFQDEALLKECRLEKPLSMQGCPICGA